MRTPDPIVFREPSQKFLDVVAELSGEHLASWKAAQDILSNVESQRRKLSALQEACPHTVTFHDPEMRRHQCALCGKAQLRSF